MPRLEEAEIKRAKEVDLLTYLKANEPHELRKSKVADEYRTATHGSLVISKGLWFWNRGGFGGRSALDFLIKVRGMNFLDATEAILDSRGMVASGDLGSCPAGSSSVLPPESAKQISERADFKLPETARFPANAVSYLQKRGVCPEIINRCLAEEILYESRNRQNVIFVGRDENGKARFACRRGMRDDFKADVSGSDKRYSFSLSAENPNSRHLMVFESPIDLLSHATLQQRGNSACGLSFDSDAHRLSLGGTSDVALLSFLERHPKIGTITLCLDADKAGQTAVSKITDKLAKDSTLWHIEVSSRPPQCGAKDYNEALLRVVIAGLEHKQKHPSRHYEAAI